jgi:hypothetical protein
MSPYPVTKMMGMSTFARVDDQKDQREERRGEGQPHRCSAILHLRHM